VIEIVLQNDGGGSGVELAFARTPVAVPDGQTLLGFMAREPLILKYDRNFQPLLERVGELLCTGGLMCGGAVEPARPADDYRFEPVVRRDQLIDLLQEMRKRFGLRRGTLDEAPGRGECPRRVAQRQADAARPVVDAQNTHALSIRTAQPPASDGRACLRNDAIVAAPATKMISRTTPAFIPSVRCVMFWIGCHARKKMK